MTTRPSIPTASAPTRSFHRALSSQLDRSALEQFRPEFPSTSPSSPTDAAPTPRFQFTSCAPSPHWTLRKFFDFRFDRPRVLRSRQIKHLLDTSQRSFPAPSTRCILWQFFASVSNSEFPLLFDLLDVGSTCAVRDALSLVLVGGEGCVFK